jgi:hypothetical protein
MIALTIVLAASMPSASASAIVDGTRSTNALITTLGADTIAVESYVRSSDKLVGDILLRVPGTTRFHYELTFDADGGVKKSIFEIKPIGAPGVDDERRLSMEFDKDKVRIVSTANGEQQTATRPTGGARAVLFMGGYGASNGIYNSFGMYEHVLARLNAGAEPTQVVAFGAATAEPAQRFVKRISPTQFDVDFFKMAWTHIGVDEQGRIVSADASETTEKTTTKRVETLDIAKLEKEFVALDKSGKGIGPASPNVEAKGTIAGASVTVRYGSPRLRGRGGVMEQLAKGGKVWRTGANEATVIEIDRDMTIGGARLPKGKYSLFTVVTPAGVQLIVNKETGQWGVAYKQSEDLVRVPMTVTTVPSPTENFTISLVPTGELRMAWDTFVWTVPFAPVGR